MTPPPHDDRSGWLDARMSHLDDFDVAELARAKRRQGLTVSVVLPAMNEAETVVGMIRAVDGLRGTLVDEVVVMDGGSDDGTAELAAGAGARVHDDTSVLSELGPGLGKGDALWRSLAVTSGDVVAFIDSDIRNPSPGFVVGLLGPLLHDPSVQLTKAFYDRPLQTSSGGSGEGGRVTELLARPLLNLLWPPLAGLVQPLSGEYAGRRELLERIPFFTGYGVELGMLVDTLDRVGVDAIAQCDVGERIHGHQPIAALSRMSFAILQVALRRLDRERRVVLDDVFGGQELPTGYLQFVRDDEGRIRPDPHEVEVVERPPFATLDPGSARRSQQTS